ncbi:MAG TPA: M50 family metallopeptidase [Polyangiales bacterium]|nr:M50 family metallopeptidase [Polyangiales bacterium]
MPPANREHTVVRVVFVVSVALTIALYAVPDLRIVAYPLLLLSTLVHEMGHGLAALAVGGSFTSFEMFSDGSGVAHTTGGDSRLAAAFVAAGGLIGPAVAGALSFVAGRRPGSARVFLSVLCLGALVALALVVRNAFGWVFVGSFALLLGALVLKGSPRASQVLLVFLGTQLGLSVFSHRHYLFTDTAVIGGEMMPSDVAQIANALLLPHWFWGVVCAATSVLALTIGARMLWRA